MKPDQWQRVKELCGAALQRAPGERARFLAEACADEGVRREVETLLAAYESKFMEQPAVGEVAEMIVSGASNKLAAGARVGHYEIVRPVGAGGMGEVYLAQDTRLNRRVAIKFLPSDSAADEQANGRLLREAQAAAALEHPHICAVHEIGEAGGRQFIVMQYVEGETLGDRLKRAPVPLKDALDVAAQVADALAEAHAHGIMHRDIKPANIIVNPRGQVKVFDFGLAKRIVVDSEDKTQKRLSQSGVIMGTVAYMSPEQARGQQVDARTDVWSLGVVLYEMVAGSNPFVGETMSDCLAAILKTEPPLLEGRSEAVPVELQHILKKALRKDRIERYQTANELLLDLTGLQKRLAGTAASARPAAAAGQAAQAGDRPALNTAAQATQPQTQEAAHTRRQFWLIGALAAGLLAVSIAGLWFMRARQNTLAALNVGRITQLTIWSGLDDFPSISPDGNAVAYCSDHGGGFEIYVKALTPGAKELQLTADGGQNFEPAWSPDGQYIAYYSKLRGGIWVMPAAGGGAKQLTEFGSYPAWSPDGSQLAFQSNPLTDLGAYGRNALPPSTLWLVAAQGGEPRQLTQVGQPAGGHGSPVWSPDGKRIAFEVDDYDAAAIWTISVNGNEAKRVSVSQWNGYGPVYAPDGQSIFYSRGSGVLQMRVSPDTGEPIGEPTPVTGIGGPPSFVRRVSFSADGKKAAYSLVRRSESISAVFLQPKSATALGPPLALVSNTGERNNFPSFSPDGKRIAFVSCDLSGTGCRVWLMNTDGSNQTQLTAGEGSQLVPNWFPDMSQVAYVSNRTGHHSYWAINLESKREKMLLDLPDGIDYARLSPDGKQIVFNSKRGGGGVINVWTAALAAGEPKQLTFDKEMMGFPGWSPDGEFIAFQMKRGDDTHVMVMPSEGGTPVQLTFAKGQSWTYGWSPDGDKVLFAGFRNGLWNVWWVSRATKKEQQLTDYKKLNSFVRYPSWSPKGDQVVYEYSETNGNIWVADLK
ncbi:MAG TPA: protein kinase [Pyrinomonadaceae bacterium]|jgi:Tol biopolymer transport system component/predicted Ser/Thr protein kinase